MSHAWYGGRQSAAGSLAWPQYAGNARFPGRKHWRRCLESWTCTLSSMPGGRIALIAHDNKKADIAEWARFNRAALAQHDLCATGTTGQLLTGDLGLRVNCLRSGPLGGDQQIGARIAEGEIDMLI